MTNLVKIDVTLPLEQPIQHELNDIAKEYKASRILQEISIYRIVRIHRNKTWQQIIDDEDNPVFPTWEKFVSQVSDELSISRQLIFDRIKVYAIMNYLGYTDVETVVKLSEQPSFYKRLFDMTVDWNSYLAQPNNILIPGTQSLSENDAKEKLKNVIEDAEAFDTQKEAIAYLETEILKMPHIKVNLIGNNIIVNYTIFEQNPDGEFEISKCGTITYFPDSGLPNEVIAHLSKLK